VEPGFSFIPCRSPAGTVPIGQVLLRHITAVFSRVYVMEYSRRLVDFTNSSVKTRLYQLFITERMIKTLLSRIWRYFTFRYSAKFVDVLPAALPATVDCFTCHSCLRSAVTCGKTPTAEPLLPCCCYAIKANFSTIRSLLLQFACAGKGTDLVPQAHHYMTPEQ